MDLFAKEKDAAVRIIKKYAHVILSAAISGFAAYGFMMYNVINSWDNVGASLGKYGSGIVLGRWLLQLLGDLVGKVWGNYSVPAFNIAVAVILLSAAACFAVSALGIKNRALAVAASSLLVTFPAIGAAVIYTFTVHYYALAVLFAAAGVCVTVRKKYGFLWGGLLIALSMGIYQAYLPFAAALLVLSLAGHAVTDCGDGDGGIVMRAVRYFSALLCGAVVYFLMLAVFMRVYGSALADYQGVSDMGSVFSELPRAVLRAYRDVLTSARTSVYGVGDTLFIRVMTGISLSLTAALAVFALIFVKSAISGKLVFAASVVLLPLASGSVVVMSPNSYIHLLMTYGMSVTFIAPTVIFGSVIACRERITTAWEALKKRGRAVASASFAAVFLTLSLSSVNYAWQSNGNYMLLWYTNEQTTEYFSSMVTRLRSTDGYTDELPLAVIGGTIADGAFANRVYNETPFRYTGTSEKFINIYSRDSWLSNYLGFAQRYADEATTAALAASDEVRAMALYPDDGSIRVIDGVLVLKLGEPEE